MKVLTWNVQWFCGIDGVVDVARVIAHARSIADFDVLCLQEVAINYPRLEGGAAQDQPQLLRDDTRRVVDGARRGERNDHVDRPVGIASLRRRECAQHRERQRCQPLMERPHPHRIPARMKLWTNCL